MKKLSYARSQVNILTWTVVASSLVIGCSNSGFDGQGSTGKPIARVEQPSTVVPTHQTPVSPSVTQPTVTQPNVTPQQPVVSQPVPVVPVTPTTPVVVNPPAPISNTPQPISPQPATESAMVRVPIIGIVNMDSKYQITNVGYRVTVENEAGKVLASGPLNVRSVMDGQAFDAQGSAYSRPYLLGVKPQYLAPEILNGQLQGQQSARVSICMPEDINQAWNTSPKCRDLNKFVGHSNGSNTFVRLKSDVTIQGDQVGITAMYNASSKGNCGTNKIACASVMHPIYGFAAESNAFAYDNASPLVLDLNKNGKIDLLSAWRKEGPVKFDLTGSKEKIRMGWVAAQDGLLALDSDKNGTIDSGREIFGEHTAKIDAKAKNNFINGFLALAQYDSNKDGVINASDAIFKDLLVWQDRNSDGISQKDELASMAKAGIAELSLTYETLSTFKKPNMVAGNDVKLMGGYKAIDGKTYKMADVWFELRLHNSLAQIMNLSK